MSKVSSPFSQRVTFLKDFEHEGCLGKVLALGGSFSVLLVGK